MRGSSFTQDPFVVQRQIRRSGGKSKADAAEDGEREDREEIEADQEFSDEDVSLVLQELATRACGLCAFRGWRGKARRGVERRAPQVDAFLEAQFKKQLGDGGSEEEDSDGEDFSLDEEDSVDGDQEEPLSLSEAEGTSNDGELSTDDEDKPLSSAGHLSSESEEDSAGEESSSEEEAGRRRKSATSAANRKRRFEKSRQASDALRRRVKQRAIVGSSFALADGLEDLLE